MGADTAINTTQYCTPAEVTQQLIELGYKKTKTPFYKAVWLGLYAGLWITVGGIVAQIMAGNISAATRASDPYLPKMAMGLTFPIALVLIMFYGGDLFTGNTCYTTMSFLARKHGYLPALKVQAVSWISNFLGAVFCTWFFGSVGDLYGTADSRAWVMDTAVKKMGQGFFTAFARGVGCNMMVCVAVWCCLVGKDAFGRILGIWICIFTFVAIGFEHCIANMFFIPMGFFVFHDTCHETSFIGNCVPNLASSHGYDYYSEKLSVHDFFIKNLIPVTLGNWAGGALVVGVTAVYIYAPPTPLLPYGLGELCPRWLLAWMPWVESGDVHAKSPGPAQEPPSQHVTVGIKPASAPCELLQQPAAISATPLLANEQDCEPAQPSSGTIEIAVMKPESERKSR